MLLEIGEGREEEGEKHQCVRNIHDRLHLASRQLGTWPLQPRHVPGLGIEPVTFWFAGRAPSTEPGCHFDFYPYFKTLWKYLLSRDKETTIMIILNIQKLSFLRMPLGSMRMFPLTKIKEKFRG